MKKKASKTSVPTETIENRIFLIRNHRVVLDSDLAELYGVSTKALNQAVRRNRSRFPSDFAFQLTLEEASEMRSQNVTASKRNLRYLPYAFTEYGALMAANILNSRRAVTMSIYVIRAFVRFREVFVVNQILEGRLAEIERMLLSHDKALRDLYKKIRRLLLPPKQTLAIGFQLTSPRLSAVRSTKKSSAKTHLT